jgi:hypothetical protein
MGTAGKEGSLKSPGKLIVGKTIQPGELAAALGKDVFKDGQVGFTPIVNSEKNTGKNVVEKNPNYSVYSEPVMSAISNSPTTAYASVMKSAAVDKRNTEWSGRNVGIAARFETLRASLLAVLTSSHPQAVSGWTLWERRSSRWRKRR